MSMSGSTSSRYYVPALASIYAKLDAYMLPLLRATLGLILIPQLFPALGVAAAVLTAWAFFVLASRPRPARPAPAPTRPMRS